MRDARDYQGQIDFGIITIRYDEFDAAFSGRFKIIETALGASGTRRYAISQVQAVNGTEYLVALARSSDQGHGPAQAIADDMIEDLHPRWLMVIGIGGCVPSYEFSLGDVLVANVVPDFSLQAVTHGTPPSFDIRGGEVHPEVEALVAHLPAMRKELAGWNTKRSIRLSLPVVGIPSVNSNLLYGPDDWRRKVIQSLMKRFPQQDRPRQSKCWTGPIGTSNTLVKDVDLMTALLAGARGLVAVEMETGGVRRAARRKGRNIPVITIRGISDVIGLTRDPSWTEYACHSTASFTYALIRSGHVFPPAGSRGRVTLLQPASGPEIAPSRLPSSGKHFVGRKKDLIRLDEAWADPRTRILTIFAWAGMGKTALVKYWLASLIRQGWCGAERVLDWSFHGQGVKGENPGNADSFIDEALRIFGDPDPTKGSPWSRGVRLANLVIQRRTLLVLDGLETLQHPIGSGEGLLKDPAIEALLKTLSTSNPGLCIITTRKPVTELIHLKDAGCPLLELKELETKAGVELLRLLHVSGPNQELEKVTEEFRGHPLSLMLLGNYLYSAFDDHDVRHWREVSLLEEDAEQGGDARRVLGFYKQWLGEKSREIAMLRVVGLFDQPTELEALAIFRTEPLEGGILDSLVGLPERAWNRVLTRLETLGLITRDVMKSVSLVDCHPLIREYFADDFLCLNPEAYREAHRLVYEYLRDNTPELPDSIPGLMRLFQAVRHGCLATKYQEAFDEVYWRRILRGEQYYSWKQLGIFSSTLSALTYFIFDDWQEARPSLTPAAKAELLSEAGISLRAVGRLSEASRAWAVSLSIFEHEQDWSNSSVVAGNLCETNALLGYLDKSVTFGRSGIHFADLDKKWQRQVINRAKLAYAHYLRHELATAKSLFLEAEFIQRLNWPDYPYLSSVQGYYFNDFHLNRVRRIVFWGWLHNAPPLSVRTKSFLLQLVGEIKKRATLSLKRVTELQWTLSMALDCLTLARTTMFESILIGSTRRGAAHIESEFEKCLELFNLARQQQELPRGLMGRAEYMAWQERWKEAEMDLDEAKSIAVRCSTNVLLADTEILRSYLYILRYRNRPSIMSAGQARFYVKRAENLAHEIGYINAQRELTAANKAFQRTLLTSRR